MRKPIFLFCYITLVTFCVQAQQGQQHFVNFGAKDGLPDKYIYDAAQDNRGYMWLGTSSGLYRYDGHRFVHFNSTADIPGRSIGNILQAVYNDEAGNLWLGSLNALQLYNPATGKFWNHDFSRGDNTTLLNAGLLHFNKGSNGSIWLSTLYSYFFRFNKKDSSFTHFNRYPSSASKTTRQVIEMPDAVYAIHAEGIYKFSHTGNYINFFPPPNDAITNLVLDSSRRRLLLSTGKGHIFGFNLITNEFETNEWFSKLLEGKNIFCLALSAKGKIYAGSYGFDIIDTVSKEHLSYFQSKNDFEMGVSKIVNLIIDRENNVWLNSYNGLSMMPWQNNQVANIAMIDKITGNTVEPVDVYAANNEIMLSNTTTAGLFLYNQPDNKTTTVINTLNTKKNISALIATPDHQWYASDGTSLYGYNTVSHQLKPTSLTDQWGRKITHVGKTIFDAKGKIYMESVSNGFYIWQYPAQIITHYNKWDIDPLDSSRASNSIIPCLADSKGNIWFTSKNCVYQLNNNSANYERIGFTDEKNIPAMKECTDIAEDRRGHIWITSIVNGLYEWSAENGKVHLQNYTRNSDVGLPADYCWRIQQSPVDSTLWINNINGLLKFDPVQKQVLSVLTKQNGLADDNGGYGCTILPGNLLVQLFFGNMNIIDLNNYRQNKWLPQVQFNSIKVLEKEYVYSFVNNPLQLDLQHTDNYLQFEFAALVFNNANQNRYTWQLLGFDTGWVQGGNTNLVSYAALKPGKYIFTVKAANNDGYWGPAKTITIIIHPPLYARWWFITLCGLSVAGLIYVYNRNKILQARREEKMKAGFQQQIAETEMKALRAQMNPHFIFNSLNSIQKYILKNDQFAASQYLTKFSRLIRLILDHSNQGSILLSSELDLLKLYIDMESMRFDNRFEYSIEVAADIQAENIIIPSMLLQPYIENAIWHGLLHKAEKGKLALHFSLKDTTLVVAIDDDGVGRDKAAALKSKQTLTKKSYGMQLTADRIALINSVQGITTTCTVIDKKDAAGVACGTRVELNIPFKTLTN